MIHIVVSASIIINQYLGFHSIHGIQYLSSSFVVLIKQFSILNNNPYYITTYFYILQWNNAKQCAGKAVWLKLKNIYFLTIKAEGVGLVYW